MRLLTFLMSIYIILLSVIPCNDRIAFSKVDYVNQLEIKNVDHEVSHSDFCSPLCSCSCCQITIASAKLNLLIKTPNLTEENFSNKIQFIKTSVKNQLYADIWQPPKILIA